MKKVKIVTESTEALAELNDTKTASAVAEALPFESIAHRWGDEIYFDIPLELEYENGKEVLEIGDVAYWPPGKSMCIFFGPTQDVTLKFPSSNTLIIITNY